MIVAREVSGLNVLDAAKLRIKAAFERGFPLYVAFSGGKDSLCLLHLALAVMQDGPQAWRDRLRVLFVDEEAIFPCVERVVTEWRARCRDLGVRFDWFCIEVCHFNCFNALVNDESFICWDSTARDVWIREMPKWAIVDHPKLRRRVDTYQEFCPRYTSDGIQLLGLRLAESVQRRLNFGRYNGQRRNNKALPLYDWTDDDVWLYLSEQRVEVPEAYFHMWSCGLARPRLRISQFFSIDTAQSLVRMAEFYPNLMDRITRREPNAYLAALYWDSEMFRRGNRARRAKPGEETDPREESQVDYRAEVLKMLADIPKHFDTKTQRQVAINYRGQVIRLSSHLEPLDWRDIYRALVAGDPKRRVARALFTKIGRRAKLEAERELEGTA